MDKNRSVGDVFDAPIHIAEFVKSDGGKNAKKIIGRYNNEITNRHVQFNSMQ